MKHYPEWVYRLDAPIVTMLTNDPGSPCARDCAEAIRRAETEAEAIADGESREARILQALAQCETYYYG